MFIQIAAMHSKFVIELCWELTEDDAIPPKIHYYRHPTLSSNAESLSLRFCTKNKTVDIFKQTILSALLCNLLWYCKNCMVLPFPRGAGDRAIPFLDHTPPPPGPYPPGLVASVVHTVDERAVRIPLECFLVRIAFTICTLSQSATQTGSMVEFK